MLAFPRLRLLPCPAALRLRARTCCPTSPPARRCSPALWPERCAKRGENDVCAKSTCLLYVGLIHSSPKLQGGGEEAQCCHRGRPARPMGAGASRASRRVQPVATGSGANSSAAVSELIPFDGPKAGISFDGPKACDVLREHAARWYWRLGT